MKVRKAAISDLEPLTELFEQYRIWYGQKPNLEGSTSFIKERMEQNESVVFVVENEETVLLGFTQLYPIFSSTRIQRLWLLNDLFVSSDARGKGLSKLLINAAKDHCRETEGCAIILETQKSNDIGNNLYPSSGFELNKDHNFYEWHCE